MRPRARERAEERLLDLLLPRRRAAARAARPDPRRARVERDSREKLARACCAQGKLDDREVEVEVAQSKRREPMVEILTPQGHRGDAGIDLKDMLSRDILGGARRPSAAA